MEYKLTRKEYLMLKYYQMDMTAETIKELFQNNSNSDPEWEKIKTKGYVWQSLLPPQYWSLTFRGLWLVFLYENK